MELRTSRYSEPAVRDTELIPIGITTGRPRFRLKYHCEFWRTPAPGWRLMRADGGREGFEKGYTDHLNQVGIETVQWELQEIVGDAAGAVLLCYEQLDENKPEVYCHRTLFAEWYQDKTGIEVPELVPPIALKGEQLEL